MKINVLKSHKVLFVRTITLSEYYIDKIVLLCYCFFYDLLRSEKKYVSKLKKGCAFNERIDLIVLPIEYF